MESSLFEMRGRAGLIRGDGANELHGLRGCWHVWPLEGGELSLRLSYRRISTI
jgi:hypothetical protein